ncbi:type II toxin-antitoxin system RelE/ParE family toxin [Nostoc sp.]
MPEFGDDTIREKFVHSYRIIYRIQGEILTIAAVIHGKRLLDKLDTD